MQRSDSPWRIRDIHAFKKRKGPGSEKGAVALVVDIEPTSSTHQHHQHHQHLLLLLLLFFHHHLLIERVYPAGLCEHASGPEGQENELTEYFSWLNGLAKKGLIERPAGPAIPASEVSNICFIMGDLNFRLFPNPKVPQEAGTAQSRR